MSKIAIITGARGGIGAAIAAKLAAEYTVIGWDCKPGGPVVDVTKLDEVMQAAGNVVAEHGRIDLLVNTCGIVDNVTFRKMTPAVWSAVLAVNLTGVWNCCKAVIEPMIAQGGGHIVSISSIIAKHGGYGQCAYAASKAGIDAITRVLSIEHAKHNIFVNAVAPGFTATEMVKTMPAEVLAGMCAKVPMKRLAEPSEIAAVVAGLAQSTFQTGQVITVDGGLTVSL